MMDTELRAMKARIRELVTAITNTARAIRRHVSSHAYIVRHIETPGQLTRLSPSLHILPPRQWRRALVQPDEFIPQEIAWPLQKSSLD